MNPFSVDMYQPPLGADVTVILGVGAAALCLGVSLWPGKGHGLSALHRGALLILRLVALAVFVWLLAGPRRYAGQQILQIRPQLTILADLSESMAQRDVLLDSDRDEKTASKLSSRWEVAVSHWLDSQTLQMFRKHVDVKLHGFDRQLQGLPVDDGAFEPTGGDTHLFKSIRQAIGASGLAGAGNQMDGVSRSPNARIMLILSDGHDTQRISDPMLIEQLRKGRWQVFAVPLGAAGRLRDLHLMAHGDADSLLDGQATTIHAQIHQSGFDRSSAKVNLMLQGRLIDSRTVAFDGAPVKSVKFRVQPQAKPGQATTLHGYRVVVEPAEGESTTENNSRWVFISSRRDRLKIVLFEGEPYWDTRFLVRVLRQDPQVDLTAVFGLGPKRVVTIESRESRGAGRGVEPGLAIDPASLTQKQINRFDMVILGKGAEQFFGGKRAHLLVDFVTQRGGTLILARGRAFDQSRAGGAEAQRLIAPLEPVEWGEGILSGLRLQTTQSGQQSPALQFEAFENTDAVLTRLPDMIAATRIRKEKAGSVVWLRQRVVDGGANGARKTPMAAVAYQRTDGGGQVLAILTDGLWRWAFLPSSLQEYDSVYQNFWARTINWLAGGGEFLPGQSMSLQLSQLAVSPDEPVHITVSTRYVKSDFDPQLRLIDPSGKRRTIELQRTSEQSNQYVATIHPDTSGVYRLELEAEGMKPKQISSRLAVYDRSLEKIDTSARPQSLKELTDATGGKCLAPDQTDVLLEHVRRLVQSTVPDRKIEDTFAQPWAFVVLVAALALEWYFRRRWGLI